MKALTACVIVLLLVLGSPFNVFGDEVDNLLGGRVIASGGVLYVDYWSHHMPLPYHIGAAMYVVGARTYSQFRLLWALLVGGAGVALAATLRRPVVWAMVAGLALVAPWLKTNMLIAESLVGYLALAAWLILRERRTGAGPVLLALAWLIAITSLKHVPLALWLAGLTVWQQRGARRSLTVTLLAVIAVSLGYVALSRNGAALIDQAYHFNATYYPPYAVVPGEPLARHPLAVVAVQLWDYIRAQMTLPTTLAQPFAALTLFTLARLVQLLMQRAWFEVLALGGLLALSYPVNEPAYRSGPHFIAHHAVLFGVSLVIVGELWHPSRARSQRSSG